MTPIPQPNWDEPTRRLHREAPVVLAYQNPVRYYFPDRMDFSWFVEEDPRVQGSLPRLRAGGVDLTLLSMGVETEPIGPGAGAAGTPSDRMKEPVFHGAEQVTHMLRCLEGLCGVLDAHADQVEVARTVADVERLKREGRLAVMLHLTGAWIGVGSSRVDLQACKLEYSIVSPK